MNSEVYRFCIKCRCMRKFLVGSMVARVNLTTRIYTGTCEHCGETQHIRESVKEGGDQESTLG